MKKTIKGKLFGWFETGLEGTIPALHEEGKNGYDGLNVLKKGDHLKIYNKDNVVVFDDELKMLPFTAIDDMKTLSLTSEDGTIKAGYKTFPKNPSYGQFQINGYWVHALPINMELGLYYDIFFANSNEYSAELTTEELDK